MGIFRTSLVESNWFCTDLTNVFNKKQQKTDSNFVILLGK